MLVTRSAQVRATLGPALRALGYHVMEASDGQDALRQMQTQAIPESFIVGGGADELPAALAFVHGILKIPRVSHIPVVLLAATSACLSEARQAHFPDHVALVQRSSQPDRLLDRALSAHRAVCGIEDPPARGSRTRLAAAAPAERPPAAAPRSAPPPSPGGMQEAAAFVAQLVHLVAKNKLPGPMMPELVQEVRALFADDNVPFAKISALVRREQALSVRLMALANSAFYSRGTKAKTPDEALSRLGLSKTAAVLQAAALSSFIVGDDPALQGLLKHGLRRALLVAVVAERTAQKGDRVEPEQAYTVGLFHNIGATFLTYAFATMLAQKKVERIDAEAIRQAGAERLVDLNRLVVRGMKLPDAVQWVPAEEPPESITVEELALVEIVRQAVWAADRVLEGGQAALALDEQGEALGVDEGRLSEMAAVLPEALAMVDSCYA